MPLILFDQIDWGEGLKSDMDDPNHRHIFRYQDYEQFWNDPVLPYFGDCPLCKQIYIENVEFYKEKNNLK
jgi:hypothetical protein